MKIERYRCRSSNSFPLPVCPLKQISMEASRLGPQQWKTFRGSDKLFSHITTTNNAVISAYSLIFLLHLRGPFSSVLQISPTPLPCHCYPPLTLDKPPALHSTAVISYTMRALPEVMCCSSTSSSQQLFISLSSNLTAN